MTLTVNKDTTEIYKKDRTINIMKCDSTSQD